MYIVEFQDGHEEALYTNFISEYMSSQVNEEEQHQLLVDKILHIVVAVIMVCIMITISSLLTMEKSDRSNLLLNGIF